MTLRLNGRQRIGIVASVVVFLGTWIYGVSGQNWALVPTAFGADITYDGEGYVGSRACKFYLIGDIAPGDGDIFRNKMLRAIDDGCLPHKVVLYSPGGDLKAAIDIGRQLNLLNMHTEAPTVWGIEGEPPEKTFLRMRSCHFKGRVLSYDPITQQGDSQLCLCQRLFLYLGSWHQTLRKHRCNSSAVL